MLILGRAVLTRCHASARHPVPPSSPQSIEPRRLQQSHGGRYLHGDEAAITAAGAATVQKIWNLPQAQAAFNN
jgi:hypothetical protein